LRQKKSLSKISSDTKSLSLKLLALRVRQLLQIRKTSNIFKRLKAKLAKLQKKIAKKEKFSNRWRRSKSKITKLHIRIADIRIDYLHKISSQLSKNHAIVILEDLKVANMSSSAKETLENPGTNVKQKSELNRAILDQGWGEFIRQLGYKLTWNGGQLIQVNPRNTSRKCPKCNYISAENRKTQATFCCQQNNWSLD
jgi:putative transposase